MTSSVLKVEAVTDVVGAEVPDGALLGVDCWLRGGPFLVHAFVVMMSDVLWRMSEERAKIDLQIEQCVTRSYPRVVKGDSAT